MAVKDFEEVIPPAGFGLPEGCRVIKWPKTGETLDEGDTGKPFPTILYPDVSVFVFGTITETVTIQGTPELETVPTKYATLHDQSDNALAITTAPAAAVIVEHATQVRPSVSSGAGSVADLEVWLVLNTQARR